MCDQHIKIDARCYDRGDLNGTFLLPYPQLRPFWTKQPALDIIAAGIIHT